MAKPCTTARMTRWLKKLGKTPTEHGIWTGLPLPEWVRQNPTWTEKDWYEMVVEQIELGLF